MKNKKIKFIFLPAYLKRMRENKDFSQTYLAKLLGFKNGQFISNIERGVSTLPPKKFKVAGRVFDIDPSFFVSFACKDFKRIIEKEV